MPIPPDNKLIYKQIRNWEDYNHHIDEGVVNTLTEWEKKIGMTKPIDRANVRQLVADKRLADPNTHEPSIRTSPELGGNPYYKPSGTISLGVKTSNTSTGGWVGLPANLNAIAIHPQNPHQVLAFKDGSIQSFNLDTTELIGTENVSLVFPEVVGTISTAYRYDGLGLINGEQHFHNFIIRNTTGTYFKYGYNPNNTPVWTYLQTGDETQKADYEAQGAFLDDGAPYIFRDNNGVKEVWIPSGNWFAPYGAGTAVFPTLPNNVPVNAFFKDKVNDKKMVFIGQTIYELDDINKVVVSATPYNQTIGPLVEHKWTNAGNPFQINLDRCGDNTIWDNHDIPLAPSIQYWNGNRRSTATGLMTNGNWTDGEVYTFSFDKNATEMTINTYGGASVVEQGVNWKVEGWGQTILRGFIYEKGGRTYFILTKGTSGSANGVGQYRSFDPAMNANTQEQMGGSVNCEVQEYLFCDVIENFKEGSLLIPILIKDLNNATTTD